MSNASPPAGLAARLAAETRAWLERARPLCHQAGRRLPEVTVRCDLRGASAGQLRLYRNGTLVIRYNLAMAEAQPEAFVAQTVPHEVAHAITHVCHGKVRPHGPEWRGVMAWFGFDEAERCHSFAQPAAARRGQRRWSYRCDCRGHQLSTTRHNRAQRGLDYVCRSCGSVLRYDRPVG